MQKRIAHITDTHLDDPAALDRDANPRKNLEEVLEDIATLKIDEIIFTGDIGEPGTYSWLFEKLGEYKPGFKVTLGNHDDLDEAVKYFKNNAPAGKDGLYYCYEDDFYKYIFLDSSAEKVSDTQLEWLTGEITTPKKIIVFIHHPILGIDTDIDNIYPLEDRDRLNELLQQCKNKVTVFCGHYHMPDKREDRNITQYTTPSVAFQVNKYSRGINITTGSFGYRIITLDENRIQSTLVINRNDYFTPEIR